MIFAYNKRAHYDYLILDKIEAGLVLTGQEVKSVKSGHCQLNGSYAILKEIIKKNKQVGTEVSLINAKISPYKYASKLDQYDPGCSRKLLLKKQEINRLRGMMKNAHLTLVPLQIYNKNTIIKVELGVCKGKRNIDKREATKKREIEIEIRRART